MENNNNQEIKKKKGRPRTDKPLKERRLDYDLKFSLKKYNLDDTQLQELMDKIKEYKKINDAKPKIEVEEKNNTTEEDEKTIKTPFGTFEKME